MTLDQAEELLTQIARKHFVTVERMRGPERNKWIHAARRDAAITLMKQGFNSVEVSRLMNRHQTTILSMQGRIGRQGGTSKPRLKKIWCGHCGTDIVVRNVRGCLRKTCEAKIELEEQTK